ncbi:NADH:flavin oxidoreductase/NADH oxidase [Thalassovita sp.]|uniref:NADH:flavin oxidoreductase/NADH oxidase n=1 Tax=Thalassovita sp. TaxID=1979401 RepID=UPI002B26F53C|nr:NADH:flavin oxidoreductase/NADH oxidase [Thalassovita sp.]
MTTEPHLFQPLTLRGVTTRNRVVISPMCQYSAHDGHMEDWHLAHLGRFAMGGAGIIFTEATAVQKRGRITHGCPGLWTDSQIPGHARIAQFALRNGAIPAIQLGHAGRKGGMQRPWFGNGPLDDADIARGDMPWTPVGPSAVPVAEGWPEPHAMTKADIDALLDDYASATARALAAGYKIAEIHGAHGYLVHSFLSPLSNQRTDEYGGDLSGRMRLALEIAQKVRAVWPDDLPLFFRTSAVDGHPDGWSLEDTVVLARELNRIGVDVMDCSSSGIAGSATSSKGQKRQPGFQVGYAERVRKDADMTTMAVGLITHPQQAENILAEGSADLIAIGREALVDPNWALHAARDLGHDTMFETWPEQSGWWLAGRQKTSEFYVPKGDDDS